MKTFRVLNGLFAEQAFDAVGGFFEGAFAFFECRLAAFADEVACIGNRGADLFEPFSENEIDDFW